MPRVRLGLAILSLTALLAAGCGDDDGDETTPAVETTPPAETQPAPPPPTEPEPTTVPDEEPPADDEGDNSGGGAEAPPGDEDAGDGAVTAPSRCGRIAFEHGADAGASGIQAVGVDCDSARALARAAGDHGDDLAYESRGFDCAGARRDEPPVPMVDWVCLRNPNELVKFSTS